MEKISDAFAFIFSDDEWFNKVLVGGFYFLLTPFLIGLVMILGFQVELTRYVQHSEYRMPQWRNAKAIFTNGIRTFCISTFYVVALLITLWILNVELLSPTTAAVLLAAHVFLNPIIVNRYATADTILPLLNPVVLLKFIGKNIRSYFYNVIASTALIGIAVFFGWMWIVVGWPLLIFLGMLVQTVMFAKS